MTAPDFDLAWRKSKHSEQGECVEVAPVPSPDAIVAIRDSKNPSGPQIRTSRRQFTELATAIKAGDLDL